MLSAEEKKALHQLENELLMQEEEKRHLLIRDQALNQEERVLHNTLAHANKSLDENKVEKAKIASELRQVGETIQSLQTKIKNHR
ncbi:MAG: hypothetical protein AAB845_01010 [Patescibacteria group bacterium]